MAMALSGCAEPDDQAGGQAQPPSVQAASEPAAGSGKPSPAEADNMLGGRDADGFVRLPGEPSRGDDAYYVTGEVCQQFTVEFMEGIMGRAVLKAEPTYAELTNCQYDLGEPNEYGVAPNVLLSLSFLPIEGQIKGHEAMHRSVAADPSIPMQNYVVKQENGLINEIYLVLGPSKYLSINRGPGNAVSEDEMLTLAIRLGEKIKEFK
jgi:hypothetical protein